MGPADGDGLLGVGVHDGVADRERYLRLPSFRLLAQVPHVSLGKAVPRPSARKRQKP